MCILKRVYRLAAILIFLLVGVGVWLAWQSTKTPRQTNIPVVTQNANPSALPETYLDYDFSAQPTGALGFTSGSLTYGSDEVGIQVIPQDLSPIKTTTFPCEEGKLISGYQGRFVLQLGRLAQILGDPPSLLDQMDLGRRQIWPDTEIDATFRNITINTPDKISLMVYPLERSSCDSTKLAVFGYDPNTDKLIRYTFRSSDGQTKDYIYLPKGLNIPHQDKESNIVEQIFTGKSRLNITYQLLPNSTEFIEISRSTALAL